MDSTPVAAAKAGHRILSARTFGVAMLAFFVAGMTLLTRANQAFAPEMYAADGMVPAAEAHAQGLNYSVFDLNLNVRALRDAQLARLPKTPEVIILGASQWQEAHSSIFKGMDVFNAHIHRDYWEDLLGMVQLLERHDRLPKKLIIAIRDKQFTPVDARKDFLWEPGIPAYRAMADELAIPKESWWKTAPWHRIQALISLPMLFNNMTRWYNAPEHPGPTHAQRLDTMEVIMPDGSIMWAQQKLTNLFTAQRMKNEVATFAAASLNSPPLIDDNGLESVRALFKHLKKQGVQVYLTNPPFNPEFYDQIAGTPYAAGLEKIEKLTQDLAQENGFETFGSFNPHKAGCTSDMYIDAEHSNPNCLQKVFDEFLALPSVKGGA